MILSSVICFKDVLNICEMDLPWRFEDIILITQLVIIIIFDICMTYGSNGIKNKRKENSLGWQLYIFYFGANVRTTCS